MANKSFSDKMVGLTNDRTVTTTPSFLEVLAPLMSILFFSGGGEDIGKLFGGKGGKLPTEDMMKNQAAVQGAAQGIVGDIRGPAAMGPAMGSGTLTPEMIMKLLTLMPKLAGLGL